MNNLSKLFMGLFAIIFLNSCETVVSPDAYGNFEDDALIVSAESAGKLIFYDVEEGKIYKKDAKMAVVDTMQLHLRVEILKAGISAINSKAQSVESQRSVLNEQLDIQQRNQKRTKKMYKDGSATQKQFDDINAQVSITKQKIKNISVQQNSVLAEKQSVTAQIQQVTDLINKCTIQCPIDGSVLVSFTKENEFTAPGKPLFTIQNTQTLTLKAFVSEPQLYQIKTGQKLSIHVDGNDDAKSLEGEIYWISSRAEFTPKQIQTKEERINLVYAIKIRVNNPKGKLKIGMPADINF